MFLHEDFKYETFLEFVTFIKHSLFSTQELEDIQQLKICSDEDPSIAKAIRVGFNKEEVIHILCARHLEQSVQRKLSDFSVRNINDVVRDIFGKRGLVESKNENDFNNEVIKIHENIDCPVDLLDPCLDYLDGASERIKNGICKPAWQKKCALKYKNNFCESMNKTVKEQLSWSKVMPHKVVEKALEISRNQWNDVRAALSGQGNYKVTQCAEKFVSNWTNWNQMDLKTKNKEYDKFIKFYCKKDRQPKYVTSTNKKLTIKRPKHVAKKPGTSKKSLKCTRTVSW